MGLKENPRIPEGINASQDNHLSEFALLLLGVGSTLVLLVVLLSVFIRVLAPLTPFGWEQRLAGAVTASIQFDSRPPTAAFDDAEVELKRLSKSLEVHFSDSPVQFEVHLLDMDMPNAFATLGGQMFVTTGLLRAISSENGLAMVVAHEMAHIHHRHPIQSLSRGVLLQLVLALVTGAQGSDFLSGTLGQAGFLTLLSFSRDMEREADATAIEVLLAQYGHLSGAEEFFVAMHERHDDSEWQTLFQTHPGIDERITVIHDHQQQSAPRQVTPLSKPLTKIQGRNEH